MVSEVVTVGPAAAQTSSAQPARDPTFEVVSIKRNTSGDTRSMMDGSGGRYTATNITLRFLIKSAYRILDEQLAGGPRWMDTDRFDVVASRGGAPPDQVPAMLRAMLEQRFNLKAHHEMRDMPMYSLVLARTDGTLGPRVTSADCTGRPNDVGISVTPRDAVLPCNTRFAAPGRLRAGGIGMRDLAVFLTPMAGRIVLDRTGLAGAYDLEMTWMAEQPRAGDDLPAPDPNGASFFTALQEQLGLKLTGGRGPVDVLVIDGVSQPTDN